MKQICVIGLSQFGEHLARTLVRYGCEILAVDLDEDRVNAVRDHVHRALLGDARNAEMLESIISESVDTCVLSLGDTNIEPSILCTLHLRKLGVKTILSTARNEDHASILLAVGATEIIFPEQDTAVRVARRVANPDLRDMFPLEGEYRIMEIAAPEKFQGRSLADSALRREFDMLVLAIKPKAADQFQFLPSATTVIQPDDVLMVMGRELDLVRFAGLD